MDMGEESVESSEKEEEEEEDEYVAASWRGGIRSHRYISEYEEFPSESMRRSFSSISSVAVEPWEGDGERSLLPDHTLQCDGFPSTEDRFSSKNSGIFNLSFWRRKKKSTQKEMIDEVFTEAEIFQHEVNVNLKRFSYKELSQLTNEFSFPLPIYDDGDGFHYQGCTQIGSGLLVKKVRKDDEYMREAFWTEVRALSMFQHPHIVKCIGWCVESDKRLLVYDFSPNGTLKSHLHSLDCNVIPWDVRYRIALELASAIHYIHEECDSCVLHRNIKPSSVLLDSNYQARLFCFSLAKLVDHGIEDVEDRVVGPFGYIDPAYFATCICSKSSDVYSFGILLLELATGLEAIFEIDSEKQPLTPWVLEMYNKGMLCEAVDKRLKGEFNQLEVERVLLLGLRCAEEQPEGRPSMQEVIQYLKFGDPVMDLKSPFKPPRSKPDSSGTPDNQIDNDNGLPWKLASCNDHINATLTVKAEESSPILTDALEQTDGSSHDRNNMFSPTRKLELQSDSEHALLLQDVRDESALEILIAEENFDIGIPSSYSSCEVPKEYHFQVMKGFMSAVGEKLEKGAHLDELLDTVKGYTTAIMMMQAPLMDWNSLVQYVLRALREIEKLKAEHKKEEVFPTTVNLSSVIASIEEGRLQLARLELMANSVEEEHASLSIQINDLERQLAESRERMEDLQSQRKGIEQRIKDKAEDLEHTRAERSILVLYDSVLSKISSFSCS